MTRIPVISKDGKPLMPTKPSRARKWVESGRAVGKWSDLGVYYVQLQGRPSGTETQPVVVGLDPGKSYSGVGVQSANCTLLQLHLILPFNRVRARMDKRRLLRRSRRGRRINRDVPFKLRNHRQKRFNNQGKTEFIGYIGGYSEVNKVVSLYDWQWKRIGQFSVSKTMLIRRSNGLCVA